MNQTGGTSMGMSKCDCNTVCHEKTHYGYPKNERGLKLLSLKEIAESPMIATFLKGFNHEM